MTERSGIGVLDVVGQPSFTHRLTTIPRSIDLPIRLRMNRESNRMLILYTFEVEDIYTPGLFCIETPAFNPQLNRKNQADLESKSASTARLEEIRKTVADNYAPLAHNRIESQTGRERKPALNTRSRGISQRWTLPAPPPAHRRALTSKLKTWHRFWAVSL